MNGPMLPGGLRARIALLLVLALPGCGTIMNRPRQVIEVRTRPEGATVRLENTDRTWTTPARFRLRRRAGPYRLLITKDGFQMRSVTLRQEISEWTWIGTVLTLGAGYVVDSLTGSKYDLEPHKIRMELMPQGEGRPSLRSRRGP